MWRRLLIASSSARRSLYGAYNGFNIAPRTLLFTVNDSSLNGSFTNVRNFGVANVWIDKETAAARAATRNPKRTKSKRNRDAEAAEKPTVRYKRGKPVRTWKDGTPRPPGREGKLRMLDSGKLIGRNRIALVNKYGMPKRIPRKIRLARIEKRRQEKELERKMERDPVLKEKVMKELSEGPPDTGAVRRLREKRMDMQKMNKLERKRDAQEKAAAAHFSTPLKSEEKKVMTLYGEMDVTAAKKYKEIKAAKRRGELLASSEQVLQIEAGLDKQVAEERGALQEHQEIKAPKRRGKLLVSSEQVLQIEAGSDKRIAEEECAIQKLPREKTQTAVENDALKRLRERALKLQREEEKRKELLAAKQKNAEDIRENRAPKNVREKEEESAIQQLPREETKAAVESDALQRLRERALKLQREEEIRQNLLAGKQESSENIRENRAHKYVRENQSREHPEYIPGKVEKMVVEDKKLLQFTEEKIKVEAGGETKEKLNENTMEGQGTIGISAGQFTEDENVKVEVTAMDDFETNDDEKYVWSLDSTRPIDDSVAGTKLANILGANALMGFPRLTKAKKTRPKPKKVEDDIDDLVLSPQPHTEEDIKDLPKLYQPEERSISLERQIIEKTLDEYHMILEAESINPRKKPWIRRVLKIDKDDITSKRYETPEERRATGCVDRSELSAAAKFRLIQPSREVMQYIDSQLLGRRRLDEWRKAGYNVKLHAPLDNVPFHKGEEKHRIHQSVFRNPHVFIAAAKVASSIPPAELPEIAFAGRTNAGKSKLINALTRRHGTARTSPIPGKTESLNFYVLGEKLCLVDMPGYSFMYGKQEHINDLRQLTKDYITIRDELKRVCLLIDAQWGLRQKDQEFIDFLESVHRKYQIVLTKTDKISPLDLGRRYTQVEEAVEDCKYHVGPVMMVSAKSGAGIGKFRMCLANLL